MGGTLKMPSLFETLRNLLALGPVLEGINRHLVRMENGEEDERTAHPPPHRTPPSSPSCAASRTVRKAVDDALAANPSLTPEDLAAVSQAADDLDAGQAEISAAIADEPTGEG